MWCKLYGRMKISPALQIFNKRVVGFFALLFVIEWFLYFRHAAHFFQGDSVFLLYHRPQSFIDLLQQFIRLHASGWYRPLANDVFEYALYPFFGINPIAYRIPVYAFFIGNTIAVYALALAVTRRELVAVIATCFLAIHSVGGLVTYDLGFLPDLMYGFFYLLAVLAYVRYLERGSKPALAASLAFFVASLTSKEAAVTLPGVLVVLYFVVNPKPGSLPARVVSAFKACSAHILLMVVYLAFVLGYLNVQNFSAIASVERPRDQDAAGYRLALDDTVLKNADLALTWAMNIPRGYMGEARQLTPGMLTFLKVFRIVLAVSTVFLLIGRDRMKAIFGISWFYLALVPSLPLVDHLLPNYLLLPLAGLSIVVGMAFTQLYDAARRLRRLAPAAAPALVAIFAAMLYVCNHGIQNDIRENYLLGGSAGVAAASLKDLKRLYPTLPPDVTLFFEDREQPLVWEHSSGGLLKMAYNTKDVSALYASRGDALGADERTLEKTIMLRYRNKGLVDETAEMRANPLAYVIRYLEPGNNALTLSKTEVRAGESYTLSVSGVQKLEVRIAYTIDDGRLETFTANLDEKGQAKFDVSPSTKKGLYRFLGFNISGQSEWIRSDATISVR